jgi:hypothetical protein
VSGVLENGNTAMTGPAAGTSTAAAVGASIASMTGSASGTSTAAAVMEDAAAPAPEPQPQPVSGGSSGRLPFRNRPKPQPVIAAMTGAAMGHSTALGVLEVVRVYEMLGYSESRSTAHGHVIPNYAAYNQRMLELAQQVAGIF